MAFSDVLPALRAASDDARAALAEAYAVRLAAHDGDESLGQLLEVQSPEPVDISRHCETRRARNVLLANTLGDVHQVLQVAVPDFRGLKNCGQRTLVDILNALLISLSENHFNEPVEDPVSDVDATLCDLLEGWTASLSDRERLILRHRVLWHDRNLDDLGKELGVSRERVRQLEKRLLENFAKWRENPQVAEQVADLYQKIRAETPLLTTIESVAQRIPELSEEIRTADCLLHSFLEVLIPDLDIKEPWLAIRPLPDLRDATFHAAIHGGIGEGDENALGRLRSKLDLDNQTWDAWLDYCGLREIGGVVVRKSASQPELAVAILRAVGHPLSGEEIAERLDVVASRALRGRLQTDDRIARVGPNSYGLPEWELETYEGIREEIVQRIERGGGQAWLSAVVDELVEQFGVSPASVRAYAARREFARRDGWISLAGSGNDGLSRTSRRMPSPQETRRCFFHKRQWWFRVDVNKETLRGSGFTAPRGAMALFQVAEGTERSFAALAQEVRVSWVAPQPQIGSIRPLAMQLQAHVGDVLWLAPAGDGAVRARLVRAWSKSDSDEIALRAGVQRGLKGEELRSALAGALEVPAEASWDGITMALRARGDLDLAELVEGYTLSDAFRELEPVPDLGDFFAALGGQ
ncbi:sigma factor-like helix-turn-helix DNA-binding protein [Nonomuraea sp. NPDC047897]|uniref:sigma factor-like helix-turn-helix DNA-binding protein n=1 Tax=Nonomuraea sp. NPDC047897 TaxID=3364346 RepID=UPI003721F284